MKASAALSCARRAQRAARQAAEQVRDELGGEVHAALVWVTPPFASRLQAICATLARALGTEELVGCVSPGVYVGGQEVFDAPALALMGLRAEDGAPRPEARLCTGLFDTPQQAAAQLVEGSEPEDLLIALVSAERFKATPFLEALEAMEGGQVVGGGACNPLGPDYVFVGDRISDDAIACLRVPGGFPEIGITQSCGPISPVHQVTRRRGADVLELDGQDAALRLFGTICALQEAGRELSGVLVGLLGASGHPDPQAMVVRPVVSVDTAQGALRMGAPLGEGARLVFLRRDPDAARADLNVMLLRLRDRLLRRQPAFAVWTSCAARGAGFYGIPGHDPAIIAGYLPEVPVAGFASGFELAPLQHRLDLNLFSGVLAAAG